MKTTITSANLISLIDQTVRACCKDKYRAILCGVLFVSDGANLKLVATDTHRLAVNARTAEGDAFEFILSATDVRAVKKVLRLRGDCAIEFEPDMETVAFTTPTGTVYATPISGQFPNYQRVIPSDFSLEVLVDKDKLTETFTALMSHKPFANKCEVNMNDGILAGFYGNKDCEVCESAWTANPHGWNDFAFAVNGAFLLDALKSVPADTVRLRFQSDYKGRPGNLKPITIDGGPDTANLHVLMPMQIA